MAKLRKHIPSHPEPTPSIADKHIWEFKFVRDLIWLGVFLLILWFCFTIWSILLPLVVATFFAYLFNPLVHLVQRKCKISRLSAIAIIFCILFLITLILLAWLLPLIIDQTISLAKSLPGYATSLQMKLSEKTQAWVELLPDSFQEKYDWLQSYINEQIELDTLSATISKQLQVELTKLREDPLAYIEMVFSGTQKTVGTIGSGASKAMGFIGSGTSQALGVIGNIISSTSVILLNIALIPFYFFFIAWDFDAMVQHMEKYLPARKKASIKNVLRKMDDAIIGFFAGRVIIGFIMGILFAFGWWLVGVPYWFILGMGTGLLNIIPYVSVIGWPIAILLKYLDVLTSDTEVFGFLAVFVWPSLVFLIVQLIEGWLLTPMIQSKSTDLSMVTIIIVVFIGGALGGLLGLLLAIPVAACIKILVRDVISPYFEEAAKQK
jgi:predicted PurR-regulated permease PerM